MFSFTLIFDDREQARECRSLLLKKYSFAGELAIRPVEDGEWRLTAYSEKRFRTATLEKLPGRVEDE